MDEPLQDGVELGIRADTDQAEGNDEGQGGPEKTQSESPEEGTHLEGRLEPDLV